MIEKFLQLFQDLPKLLSEFTAQHGVWVYALLFAIIFIETGLVIMPFLPGDSLLFTIGALSVGTADRGAVFNPWLVGLVLIAAGILGDNVNYTIGRSLGKRLFPESGGSASRFLNRKHLDKAHAFYAKHGMKSVILGHFVPIVRTFVPFVAGMACMNRRVFMIANAVGVVAWVGLCIGAGVLFGNIDWVKKNFEGVVIGIVVVSLIPVVVEFVLARRAVKAPAEAGQKS